MRSRIKRKYNWNILKKVINIAFYSLSILITFVCITFLYFFITNTSDQVENLTKKVYSLEKQLEIKNVAVCDAKDSIKRVRGSIVRIIGGEGEGSGFAIDDEGTILTNFHVIEYEPSPKVVLPDNTFETADIILTDKKADLAILKIERDLPVLELGDSDILEQADELFVMGFPFGHELQGELSVKKGILAGKRYFDDMQYLQIDNEINQGLSGGPMTNSCGEVVGVNTLGTSGSGLAISSNSLKKKWEVMKTSGKDPLEGVSKLDIKPNENSLLTVQAFYNYIKLRKLENAFKLLGDSRKNFKFENWKKGYMTNMDTSVIAIKEDEKDKNEILIKLQTIDLLEGAIVLRYYEGSWMVKEVDGQLLLIEPDIKEVKEPDWDWFYF